MTQANGHTDELWRLMEALCEQRLTADESARLERLVLADRTALRFYLDCVELHGTLHWDTALGGEPEPDFPSLVAAAHRAGAAFDSSPAATAGTPRRQARRYAAWSAVVSVCLLAGLALWLGTRATQGPNGAQPGADDLVAGEDPESRDRPADRPTPDEVANTRPDRRPVQIGSHGSSDAVAGHHAEVPSDAGDEAPVEAPTVHGIAASEGTSGSSVVALIDREIREGWTESGVSPSPPADDAEWLRRVYLDVIGRIPSAEEAEAYLASRDPHKRTKLVDRLLDEPAYARNWTTIWSNLLVGRSDDSPDVDRFALKRFLRDAFARNRPWSETVYELVAAEGDHHENGAANYLLAHLNNEAVPATAITARLFLGTQIQCVQCHDHPDPRSDWKQNQFWELNSFFQQTELTRYENPEADRGQPSFRSALVSKEVGGPIHYETRQGLMKVAFPKFAGVPVPPEPTVNRRRELARLMVEGDNPLVARAMVNRMWGHFFGHGFTAPVDDMGPHNPPSHPELLDQLTTKFVESGYDVKQLVRWIANSEAYQLSSRVGGTNAADDPEAGYVPLFSRTYIKPMTPEQVYDSLLVATKAHHAGHSNWEDVERQRQEWLQQFVIALGTDENDEAMTFDGGMPQALSMMNGPLVDEALSGRPGTYFSDVLSGRGSDKDKIRALCLSALSRYPTEREIAAVRKLLRDRVASDPGPRTPDRQVALLNDGLRDVFWAYLNSSEFVLVH